METTWVPVEGSGWRAEAQAERIIGSAAIIAPRALTALSQRTQREATETATENFNGMGF
jgi:hypothetical protein